MRKHALKAASLLGIALSLAMFVPQRATADDEDDPPSRVARLSFTRGEVSFNPAGTDDWAGAVVNRPLTTDDKLWTDKNSRAELTIDTAAIRLGENTGFSFLNLDDKTAQLRVTEGTISVHVRALDSDEIFEIDTPNLAFNVLRPGTYRVYVNENGDATTITVAEGDGEVTGGGSSYAVHENQSATFNGTDELVADVESYDGQMDEFDSWCADRDQRAERSESARYVSTDAIGYEDLDEYGGWRDEPDYGHVWFPHTTIVGWAPYRYGHWVWVSPWGWTWVDDAPWGFAPFHYGRWVVVRGVWGWVPCPPRPRVVTVAYVRPVYAPALVAWVGGPNFSVGVSVGPGVGWFPLGPREVYVPTYRVGPRYVTRVNVSNTTVTNVYVTNVYNNYRTNRNVTEIKYVNRTGPNAVTVVTRDTFVSSRAVGRNVVRVNERDVRTVRVNAGAPEFAPQNRSLLGAGGETRVRPPERIQNRAVVARTAPPPARVSFARQQQAIQANGGRPIGVNEERRLSTENGGDARRTVRIAPPARPGVPQNVQTNRPAQMGRPGNAPAQMPQDRNRPVSVEQPSTNQRPANTNPRVFGDRPPSARQPDRTPRVDPQLEQKQQQQMEQLRQRQDLERQRVEQQQIHEQQKLQQNNASDQRRQQEQQRQQQKLEQMERRHDQDQQKLQQRQQQAMDKRVQQDQRRQQQQQPKQEKDKPRRTNNERPHGRQ